ncbi:hypothetical protein BDY19DRAFT_722714 [Irpex rosettiformis]|uniref:Uncharacterized protein n=1 Tax=Irpex rosettiformis TaxID=378272 RepID=A0ACB8U8G1_9APHY|nr:hypothetical protein BDY19DRAFT_722714 [Irpex rosettiformis]
MDSLAYTIPNDAQDLGKGEVDTDHPAAHIGYSTVYLHGPPVSMVPTRDQTAPRSRGKRFWVRYIHWIMLYVTLVLVILFTFKDLCNVARLVRSIFNAGHSGTVNVVDDYELVRLPHRCADVVAWKHINAPADGLRGYVHIAQASVELPISSELLYFASRGYLSNGAVEFVASDVQDADYAGVDITFRYDDEELLDLLHICRLHREGEQNGVGIFSPGWTHPKDYHSNVKIVVNLPPSANIKALETHLPHFSHNVGDFRNSVIFGSATLITSDQPITAKFLSANATRLQTSNAHVSGVFNSTQSIDIITSNAAIDGEFNLYNDERLGFSRPNRMNLETSNARINADISLAHTFANHTGGLFGVRTVTSNAKLDVKFNAAPVLSHLVYRGRTTNGQATATLHETFEGTFTESTSRWFEAGVHVDETKEDPAGRGRRRHVSDRGTQHGHAEGKVVWGGSESQRRMSYAELTTTNAPAHLYL